VHLNPLRFNSCHHLLHATADGARDVPGVDLLVNFTAKTYAEVIKRLEKAGLGMPKGRLYHASFGKEDNLQVFDVWESQETFAKFGETLLPIMAEIGYKPPTPMFLPVHNTIIGR
jgi:hypothetical protein